MEVPKSLTQLAASLGLPPDSGAPRTTDLDEALKNIAAQADAGLASPSQVQGSDIDNSKQEKSSTITKKQLSSEEQASEDYLRRCHQFETIKRRIEMIKMDKEDIVTVKYLPIKLTHQVDQDLQGEYGTSSQHYGDLPTPLGQFNRETSDRKQFHDQFQEVSCALEDEINLEPVPRE